MVDSAGWQTPGSTALACKLWGSVKTTWRLCLKKNRSGATPSESDWLNVCTQKYHIAPEMRQRVWAQAWGFAWLCVYWFAYVGSSLRSKDKAHLIIVYEPVEFSLLVFYWGFDIYIYQGYWPVVFFPCSILIWLWYQGNVGLLKWVWKCYLFFVLQEFETVLVFLFWGFWLLIHSP